MGLEAMLYWGTDKLRFGPALRLDAGSVVLVTVGPVLGFEI